MRKKLLFSVVALVLFLAISEIALRLLDPQFVRLAKSWYTVQRYVRWTDHDLRPNATARFQLRDHDGAEIFDFEVATDRRALRASALAAKPAGPSAGAIGPSGVKVVHCIGDSFTFGWGVPYEDSFPYQLGQLLGSDYQVLNLGVPSFGLIAAAEKSRQIAGAQPPHAIVYLFHESDLRDDRQTFRLAHRPALVHWLSELKYFAGRHSYVGAAPWGLAIWLTYEREVWPFALPSGQKWLARPDFYAAIAQTMHDKLAHQPAAEEASAKPTLDALDQLARYCQDHGTRLAIVLMANGPNEATIFHEAQKRQIPLIYFMTYSELVIPKEFHLNERGNRLLAQFVRDHFFAP